MNIILVATSSQGKLRDFSGAAEAYGVHVAGLPGFAQIPEVLEDGRTFADNARKKAEAYSLHAPGQLVIADDSGLSVDTLDGAPGLHSARYASLDSRTNSSDEANNAKLLCDLAPHQRREASFICVLAAARDGHTLAIFTGEVRGVIIDTPRGKKGFGYDPLFFVPSANKTFAEMNPLEKSQFSHRGAAFRKFLEWFSRQPTR